MKKQLPKFSQGKSISGYLPNFVNPTVDNIIPSISLHFQKERTNFFSQLLQLFSSFLNGKTLLLALLFFVSFTTETFATHIRYGSISWRITGVNTVEYKVSYAEQGSTPLGSYDYPIGFDYGDGSSVTLPVLVTSVNTAEGWYYGEAIVTHTYASAGTYTAGMSTCCRISTLANAPDGYFILSTVVNLGVSNASPISSFSPVICVPSGVATNTFYLTATDPNGDPLTYSLNGSASGIPSYPSGLSVANDGLVTFNTVGLPSGSKYAVQILVSDGKTSIPVDFIINISAVSSPPPVFDSPTPANGSTLNASIGVPLAITLKATDPNAGDVVSLSVVGQPSGSSFSTALPASGNPSMTTLNWTPSAADAGSSFIVNVVASSAVCESAITSFTINVPNCPTVAITGLNAAYCKSASAVTLTGSPAGGSFTIDGNSATQLDPSVLSVGNHTVVYTNGCGNTASQTVTVNALPMVAITGLNAAYCKSASAVTLTGSPTGGTFTIDGTTATSLTPSILSVGNHTVVYTYTDANTCSNTASQTVAINPLPIVSSPVAGSIYLQGSSTTLSVTASSGTPPYQYSLNNGAYQNSNAFYITAGLYNVTVKDMSGCSVTSSALYVPDGTAPITCPPTIRIEFNQLTANGLALPNITGYLKTFIQVDSISYTDRLFNINCGTITGGNLNYNPTLGTDAIMALTRTFIAKNTGSIISYSCSQDIYVGAPKLADVVCLSDKTLLCVDSRTAPADTSVNQYTVLGTGYPTIFGQLLGQGLVRNLTATYNDERINNTNGFTIKRTWIYKNICTGETRRCVQNLTYRSDAGTCPTALSTISGKIRREDLMDIPAKISVYNAANEVLNSLTNPTYSFNNLLINKGYRIKAERPNTDWTNGVTTFDVALISRHVLGITPLTTPYQLIAADANRNGEVDAADLLHFQRLILRLDNQLPNNNSWRFVPKNYVFSDPTNPFASDFPEVLNVQNLTSAVTNGDFVAIKVGDVNNSLGSTAIRGGTEAFKLSVEDKVLEKNLSYEIPVRIAATASAIQYALTIDKTLAQIEAISKGDLPNSSDNNFGFFKNENIVTAAWTRSPNQKFEADERFTMVNLVIKPTKTVRLSEILSINPVYTEGVAYDEVGKGAPVKLSFGNKISEGFALYQNHPNPFSDETTISFKLPQDAQANLTITSVDGKIVKQIHGDYKAGLNTLVVKKSELQTSGVFYYRLETADFSATKKLVIME